MSHLFVYGTLMVPEVAQKIFGRTSVEKAILQNFKRLKIYLKDQELFYPALIKEKSSFTEGIIFRNLSEKELALIDKYEGEEYKRKLVQVETKEETLDACCYIWQANDDYILKDEWSAEGFREKYLNDFLEGRL